MLKNIFTILLLLSLSNLYAEDYFFKGVRVPLDKHGDYALISKECVNCMAKRALKEITPMENYGIMAIGAPGAKLCMSIEGAKYEIFDSKLGQQGFCLFSDGSYVDTDGLMYFSDPSNKKKIDN
tara:strand:+ start:8202 stop:8573 length:372 start_codon:yes stop_codon:yes gene_type:complete